MARTRNRVERRERRAAERERRYGPGRVPDGDNLTCPPPELTHVSGWQRWWCLRCLEVSSTLLHPEMLERGLEEPMAFREPNGWRIPKVIWIPVRRRNKAGAVTSRRKMPCLFHVRYKIVAHARYDCEIHGRMALHHQVRPDDQDFVQVLYPTGD